MLGRFQNSSVPVLNLKKISVPVSTGSAKSSIFGPGSEGFGSSVPTVLLFLNFQVSFMANIWVYLEKLPKWCILVDFNQFLMGKMIEIRQNCVHSWHVPIKFTEKYLKITCF